jgi:dihydrofolate reductase
VLSIIVAMSENRVIGRDGALPWHLPADLKRFKQLTMGHAIVMGRKTYESIARPLPGRRSIVLSRNVDYRPVGVDVVANLQEALKQTDDQQEVFVIGGSSLYQMALPVADRIYLTEVATKLEGDVLFPEFDRNEWQLVDSLPAEIDEKSSLSFCFKIFDRAAAVK